MDTSCVSQKNIRKVLRSRRMSIPVKPKNVETNKALQKPSMKRTITKENLDDDRKQSIQKNLSSRKKHDEFTEGNAAKPMKSISRNEAGKSIDDGAKRKKLSCSVKSKIGNSETKISTKPTSKQHDENSEFGERSESAESSISNESRTRCRNNGGN